jgi:hypothetical protein
MRFCEICAARFARRDLRGEICAGCPAYLSAIKPRQNPSQGYMSHGSMAVADFTQFEFFANMIETGAVLCITANFAADVRFGTFSTDPTSNL